MSIPQVGRTIHTFYVDQKSWLSSNQKAKQLFAKFLEYRWNSDFFL